MVSSLHQFMFSTPVRYSTLRPIVQIQHLNHELLNTPNTPKQTASAPIPPPPTPKAKHRKKNDTHETELALKVKGSELLQRATQQQFIMAGAGMGAVTSVVQALKVPALIRYTPPNTNNCYELSWFGGWPTQRAYPGKQLNMVEYHHGQRQKHTRVSMLYNGIPFISRLFNQPARKEVMHRYYNGATLHDTILRQNEGGDYTVTKALRDRHGKRLLFEMNYAENHTPKTLIHYVNQSRDKHDLHPVGNDGTIWKYNGLNATYTFKANEQGYVDYYDVAPHKGKHDTFRIKVAAPTSPKEAPKFKTHTELFKKTSSGLKEPELEKLLDVDAETLQLLEHPLAFRQLIPTAEEGYQLLETGFERLPKPLRKINQFKQRSPHHFPKGLERHYPWQEWIFKPLALTVGLALAADGLYELLFSSKSPFIQWLQTHVEYREAPETSGVLQRVKAENTYRRVAYIKDTGSEQADSDISNALEVLSSLGVINAKQR
jgi:hypothetical protein